MKKRLLSALLALALVFVLLPTTALADTTPVTDENVKINGTAVIVGNNISLGDGNGTYSYDKSTRTLTLNNATITATGSNIGIDFCDTTNYVTYSVILTGENTVTSNNIAIETTPNTNLTFTGGGNLKAITNGYYQAIRVYGTLTIENSTLIAESSAYTATTVIWTLAMTGNNAKLEISNKSAANIVAGTAGPASKNIDWSNYQFTTGSYSGDALTESDPEVCSWGTLNEYLGFPTKKYSQYICIAKRTIPALTKTSDVFIAGEKAVVSQWTNIPADTGTGSYSYDADKKELTLKDVNIASSSIINGIQFTKDGTYTINLVGTNTMSGFSTGISANSADQYVSNINITITGAGSLEVSTTSYAIAMNKGDLKFENTGAIKLATGKIGLNNNALSVKGNITITDMSKYSVTGTQQTGGKPLGSEVSLTEASQLKGGTTGYRIITITPAAAKPSTISYDGTTLKQGETIKDGKGGTATVATKGNTITLNNFKGTKALSFDATLADSTLVLEGTNTLSSIVTTQKGLTISGPGSLTVGSIRVPNITRHTANLTINGGAHVTVGTAELTTRAIDVNGSLTVTNGSLTATSASNNVPTVQVGGNASFTGSTVTITNHSDRQGKSGEYSYAVSTGLYVGGTLDIKNAAKVTSTVIGGNAIYAKGDITISGDNTEVKATNDAYKFSAISTNKTVNISDNSTVKAENLKRHQGDPNGDTDPSTGKTYNPCPAIAGKIANKNSQNKLHIVGFTTSSAGSQNPTEGTPLNRDIAPSSVEPYIHHYYVTITRGDAYTTPQVAANYTIAGQTMYVGKYYKTDARGNITEGTAQDYNIFCDSENDFTLNNATISSTGTGGSTGVIMTNLNASSNEIHIKLIGTNSINNAGHHAILGEGTYSTIIIENAENASNASLTISGNFLPVYSFGNVTINAEVVIINTNGNGYLISTNKGGHANGAFDLGSGYKCYASTSTTGTPLEEFNSANYSTYKYLRVTTQTLETGGGSTHQHTWDTTKWYSVGDDYHARKCTGCDEYDLTNKQAHYAWPDEDKGPEGHTEKCMLCDYKYDQSVIKPHEWTGWWVSDYQPEVHAQRCNCGYQGSTHRTLKYVAINSEQHQKQCPVDGCGYKIEYKTSHVYEEGSNICTECGYDKSAPCNHTGDRVYTNNGDGTHKVTCKACGATIVEKETHEFDPTGACVCGATQSGGNPTPDNPGTIVIIRPAEEEKPAQQPNPSTGANDLVGLAVAAAVAAALGSAALLRKHD